MRIIRIENRWTKGQTLAQLPTKWKSERFDVVLRFDRAEFGELAVQANVSPPAERGFGYAATLARAVMSGRKSASL
jgi:hypothetical protein